MIEISPDSLVTIFIGRQAIELGIKFLILSLTGKINRGHDLKKLIDKLFIEYKINDNSDYYMNGVDFFCSFYSEYIEGNNVEYFRFPEYKNNNFFSGNSLDINWLSWNIALILLKLIHLGNLDNEII